MPQHTFFLAVDCTVVQHTAYVLARRCVFYYQYLAYVSYKKLICYPYFLYYLYNIIIHDKKDCDKLL